jgi:branched-chain amino acid transport system substrate-binding protein
MIDWRRFRNSRLRKEFVSIIDQQDLARFGLNLKADAGSDQSCVFRPIPRSEALGGCCERGRSLKQGDVIEALDHAKIAEGPGGPAEMVPGQHHVRMNMYIAQANIGNFKIVKSLGIIDPKECMQGIK